MTSGTIAWIPKVGTDFDEGIDAYRWGDFLQNYITASGSLLCSDGGSLDLAIATGSAFIRGWKSTLTSRVETLSPTPTTQYIYLLNTISSDKATFTVASYSSEQTDLTNLIYLCVVTTNGTNDITSVTDKRFQFQAIGPTFVEITSTKTGTTSKTTLADWRHSSDLTKIDGAKIYDGSIANAKLTDATILDAKISASAAIQASKILISSSTYLSNWRHSSDLTKFDAANIYDGTVTNAKLAATTITDAKISGSAAIDPSKILISGSTYLSNWRHGSDLTKITGAAVYTGSIPTTALADGAVSVDKLGTDAVTNVKVAAAAAVVESKLSFNITTGHNHDGSNSRAVSLSGASHNDLQNIQGGGSSERYHLTDTQQSNLTGGTTAGDSQHRHTFASGLVNNMGWAINTTERSTTNDEGVDITGTSITLSSVKSGDRIFAIMLAHLKSPSSAGGVWCNLKASSNCTDVPTYQGSALVLQWDVYVPVTVWGLFNVTSDGNATIVGQYGQGGGTGSVYTNNDFVCAYLLGKTS